MKQSAVKTLGVAALGAAFAAAGAGAANAAPAAPDAGQVLGSVSKALPTENVGKTLPTENVGKTLPGTGKALNQTKPTVRKGIAAAQPAARDTLGNGPAKPVGGLLGGLPANGMPLG